MLFSLLFSRTSLIAQTLPVPSHIVILIEENYAYSDIMGTSYAPHINAFTTDTNAAIFTQFYALTHPSEPNYLDFYSGADQGCIDDNVPAGYPFTTANLGAELLAASKAFVTYSEDLPSVGFDGATYTAGGHNYARKHNPCTNWVGTGTNQVPATVNQPFTSFPASANYSTLPTVSYVVPNMTNDMHDGTYPSNITIGDTWMYDHLDSIKQWALANNTLYIITFDEDDDLHGNNIATIFYGPMVKGGTYTNHETLINLLGTVEAMYGLGHAGSPFASGITDTPITYCWRTHTAGVNTVATDNYYFSVSPNPASDVVNFSCNNAMKSAITVVVTDELGREAGRYSMDSDNIHINTSSFAPGFYFYKAIDEKGSLAGVGKFIISHK